MMENSGLFKKDFEALIEAMKDPKNQKPNSIAFFDADGNPKIQSIEDYKRDNKKENNDK